MSSIHGHAVMEMMLEQQQGFTKASLIETINTKYGTDARFHTCSAKDLDAAALVDLLESRGKFVAKEDGFNTDSSLICNH